MLVELGISDILPSLGSVSRQPLPSAGSLRVGSPASSATTGCSDSSAPSAPLRFLRSAVPSWRAAATRPPRFLGDPPVRALLFDPGGPLRQTIGRSALPLRRTGVAFRV